MYTANFAFLYTKNIQMKAKTENENKRNKKNTK